MARIDDLAELEKRFHADAKAKDMVRQAQYEARETERELVNILINMGADYALTPKVGAIRQMISHKREMAS